MLLRNLSERHTNPRTIDCAKQGFAQGSAFVRKRANQCRKKKAGVERSFGHHGSQNGSGLGLKAAAAQTRAQNTLGKNYRTT
jgi:hypothetical protein